MQTVKQLLALSLLVLAVSRDAMALPQEAIVDLLRNMIPSIVTIKAETVTYTEQPRTAIKGMRRFASAAPIRRKTTYTRKGYGIVIDADGTILANAHTVANAGRLIVTFHDGRTVTASMVRSYPEDDLAFLRTPAAKAHPPALAPASTLKEGESIYALRNVHAGRGTVARGSITGIVYASDATRPDSEKIRLVQTNLAVRPGESGEPFFTAQGRLAGILVAGESKKALVSYAIPSNRIGERLRDLRANTKSRALQSS